MKFIKKLIKTILRRFNLTITRINPNKNNSFVIDNENTYMKYSVKKMFLKQYRNLTLNRADIVVRYLAIEQYYGKNDYGFDLYSRMQKLRKAETHTLDKFLKLIKSTELNGFSDDYPITMMSNFELFDGSHRIAIALFFGIDFIPVKIIKTVKDITYSYDFFTSIFSTKEVEVIKAKEKQIYEDSLKYKNFINSIYLALNKENQQFGRGLFYQSFERFLIKGQRPTEFRFYTYGLDKFLKKEYEVLDIGCNCGFFSLYASEYVKCIDGVEFNQALIDIANETKNYLSVENCNFYCADFNNFSIDKKYDVIFSFAVHHWIGMSMEEYSLKLESYLNTNGLVVFESQNVESVDKDFEEKISEFCRDKFKIINSGEIMDDKDILRNYKILMLINDRRNNA